MPRRRIPPVQYITGVELMLSGIQNLLAGQIGPGMEQRQYILKLIAEAKGSAGLIQRNSSILLFGAGKTVLG